MNRNDFRVISRLATAARLKMNFLLKPAVAHVLQAFAREIAAGRGVEAALATAREAHETEIIKAKGDWPVAYAVHAYNVSGALLGKKSFLRHLRAKANGKAGPTIDFVDSEELVANHLRPRVDEWVAATSKLESQTTAKQFDSLYKRAVAATSQEGEIVSNVTLAQWIQKEGLAVTRNRAELMARTTTNWGYNEGSISLYEDEGIGESEWLTTMDEVTGEWDAALDGTRVPLRDNFVRAGDSYRKADGSLAKAGIDVPHPPLHPNCRCALVPVV
ncbi:MAG: phage minor head protein [Alphaproteobacteria bacterium]